MGWEWSVWPVPRAGSWWLCSWASSRGTLKCVLKSRNITGETNSPSSHFLLKTWHFIGLWSVLPYSTDLWIHFVRFSLSEIRSPGVRSAAVVCGAGAVCVGRGWPLLESESQMLTLLSQGHSPGEACQERAVSSELSRCALLSWHFRVLSIIWGCKCILRDCLLMLQ